MKKGFPVKFSFEDIWAKALKEGGYEGIELTGVGIAPASGSLGISNHTLTAVECFLARGLAVSVAGGKANAQFTFYSGPFNTGTGVISKRFALNNSSASLNLNTIFTPGTAQYVNLRDGDGVTSLLVNANASGIRMTPDFNFGAEKVIMWVGDSISRGSSLGGTPYGDYANTMAGVSPEDHFAFQVRNQFQRRGIDCRLIIKAMGSYTSRQIGWWIRNGWLDVDQVDVVFYQLGMNDAGMNTTDQQYTDELNRLIDWRNRKHPKCKIVLVGATPANNTETENRLIQLRTIMSNIAEENKDKKVYYLSLATAFDRAIIGNYTANDGIHPNIASNKLMSAVINNWIDTTNFDF